MYYFFKIIIIIVRANIDIKITTPVIRVISDDFDFQVHTHTPEPSFFGGYYSRHSNNTPGEYSRVRMNLKQILALLNIIAYIKRDGFFLIFFFYNHIHPFFRGKVSIRSVPKI